MASLFNFMLDCSIMSTMDTSFVHIYFIHAFCHMPFFSSSLHQHQCLFSFFWISAGLMMCFATVTQFGWGWESVSSSWCMLWSLHRTKTGTLESTKVFLLMNPVILPDVAQMEQYWDKGGHRWCWVTLLTPCFLMSTAPMQSPVRPLQTAHWNLEQSSFTFKL